MEDEFDRAPDGRMIFQEEADSLEMKKLAAAAAQASEGSKRRRAASGAVASKGADSDDDDDDSSSRARGAKALASQFAAKRERNEQARTQRSRAGRYGQQTAKKQAAAERERTGARYKSAKGSGDVKVAGAPAPYAYVPLNRASLSSKKKGEAVKQFKEITTATARKGGRAGKLNKRK